MIYSVYQARKSDPRPIFSSDDIQKQLPKETKGFQQVDQLWRSTMETVYENPNVLDAARRALRSLAT